MHLPENIICWINLSTPKTPKLPNSENKKSTVNLNWDTNKPFPWQWFPDDQIVPMTVIHYWKLFDLSSCCCWLTGGRPMASVGILLYPFCCCSRTDIFLTPDVKPVSPALLGWAGICCPGAYLCASFWNSFTRSLGRDVACPKLFLPPMPAQRIQTVLGCMHEDMY